MVVKRIHAGIVACVLSVASVWAQDQVTIEAYGVMPSGERKANVTIVREEVERTTLLPLLPYVFFDEGSADIPQRYVQFTTRESRIFSEREFLTIDPSGRRSSIAAYYNVLNIIGRRLKDRPTDVVTLTGTTDGKEPATIAAARANAVKAYLMEVFGVAGEQLTTETRAMPAARTTTADAALSAQENRRVEFSGPWTIVRPVVVKDTTTTISPPAVEFDVSTDVDPISRITINAWQLDYEDPLYRYEHVSLPKTPRIWRLDRDPEHQPTSEDDLEYEAEVVDDQFRSYTSDVKTIPVRQVTLRKKKSGLVRGSTEIHQYNLILFDFGSGALRDDHRRIIDTMIASDGYVLPYSSVRVEGFTDSTGSDEINLKLSTDRAAAAASGVIARFSNVLASDAVSHEGFGKSDVLRLPDGQSLPEARMYSRTVHIIVQNRRGDR